MVTIIRNADVYAPEHLGRTDVLLLGGTIAAVGENLKADFGGALLRSAHDNRASRTGFARLCRWIHRSSNGKPANFPLYGEHLVTHPIFHALIIPQKPLKW